MTRDDTTPRGGADDERLLAALRRLGDAHEADSAAIWARVDPARADAAGPDHEHEAVPVLSLDRRRDRDLRGARQGGAPRSRPRPALLVPLAAAAVLGVLVVSQVVTRPEDVAVPTPATSPTAAVPSPRTTDAARPSPSASTTPTGDALGTPVATTARTRTRTVTVTVPPGEDPAGSTTPAPSPDAAAPSSSTSPAGLGVPTPALVPLGVFSRGLSLATPDDNDWIVVGARSDGGQVRAKRPLYPEGALAVVPPAGATVVRSPLAVSWADGTPEQTRVAATTWLAGAGGAPWTITTQRLDVPRRLTIVGGGAPSGLRLTVDAPGRSSRWTWSGNPAGSGPFSLSVVIPGGAGPVTVTLAPTGSDALAVCAVSTRRI